MLARQLQAEDGRTNEHNLRSLQRDNPEEQAQVSLAAGVVTRGGPTELYRRLRTVAGADIHTSLCFDFFVRVFAFQQALKGLKLLGLRAVVS